MLKTSEIRERFLDYFVSHGHTRVASSSLVPSHDPTLLFTTAGMVQFKDLFTGVEKRAYQRATTSQRCLRAGGKHNDLENVGFTARHHTFFEMLGNFSFGDYFKEEAISLAWRLVTEGFELSPSRLLVTVYAEDEEAATLWRKITGFSDDRIIRIPTSDNFWSMGDTGPCGPCTEIFYDHGESVAGGPPGSADADGDRFTEIWNLVFMQFEQKPGGERTSLPRPSVDTGMGLERLAAVLQGVHSNYEIDLFQHLIAAILDLSGGAAGAITASHRVIADHLRACAFLIADGVLPSNEGRGYVLRRIMRRAMRHAHILGCKDALMWRLVPVLLTEMGAAYPELCRAESLITQTLRLEEERFRDMLERGLRLLAEATAKLSLGAALPGDVAFKLYDTYGFPLDLTADALKTQGYSVDVAGFEAAMAVQRQDSRAKWAGSGDAHNEPVWFQLAEQHGSSEFLGYETELAEGVIHALIDPQNLSIVPKAEAGADILILTNQTPFYAESGGQQGDTGVLSVVGQGGALAAKVEISNTLKKLGRLHVHVGRVLQGTLTVSQPVKLAVSGERRAQLRAHHSATHLLHAALRRHLGPHVTQKGSLVAPDRLRFDFSHQQPITPEQLQAIARSVNDEIRHNSEVTTRHLAMDDAVAQGAMALFGEKYADVVRVVTMGPASGPAPVLSTAIPGACALPDELADAVVAAFSMELCGGTHVRRTGDIGFFMIVSETGVSSGVRRIEAVASAAAERHVEQLDSCLQASSAVLKTQPHNLAARIAEGVAERKKLETELRQLRQQSAAHQAAAIDQRETIQGIPVLCQKIAGVAAKELRSLLDRLRPDLPAGVIVLACSDDDKVAVVVGVSADLTSRISAVDLVRAASQELGGTGGGGRPDFAQGGGPKTDAIEQAFTAVRKTLQQASVAA